MSTPVEQLRVEFEAAGAELDIPLTTLGSRVGQGGHFHKRLSEGKRMWPETIESVRHRLHELRTQAARDPSHGHAPVKRKGQAA